MCKVKVHWSVFALAVSAVSVTLFTAAVATRYWATVSQTINNVNTGLFLSCKDRNDTCSYTHVHFHHASEKGAILCGAVLVMVSLVAMWFFFLLVAMFLCGLFDDDGLVRVAVIMSWASGFVGMIGSAMFASSVTSQGYSVGWSFLLAIVGLLINVVAGVLMCVGRIVGRKKQKFGQRANLRGKNNEVIQMGDLGQGNIWATGDRQ